VSPIWVITAKATNMAGHPHEPRRPVAADGALGSFPDFLKLVVRERFGRPPRRDTRVLIESATLCMSCSAK